MTSRCRPGHRPVTPTRGQPCSPAHQPSAASPSTTLRTRSHRSTPTRSACRSRTWAWAACSALRLAGGGQVMVYPKPDYAPASYTVLSFPVADLDTAVDELVAAGVTMERYDGFDQDDKGIARDSDARHRVVQGPGRQHPRGARPGRHGRLAPPVAGRSGRGPHLRDGVRWAHQGRRRRRGPMQHVARRPARRSPGRCRRRRPASRPPATRPAPRRLQAEQGAEHPAAVRVVGAALQQREERRVDRGAGDATTTISTTAGTRDAPGPAGRGTSPGRRARTRTAAAASSRAGRHRRPPTPRRRSPPTMPPTAWMPATSPYPCGPPCSTSRTNGREQRAHDALADGRERRRTSAAPAAPGCRRRPRARPATPATTGSRGAGSGPGRQRPVRGGGADREHQQRPRRRRSPRRPRRAPADRPRPRPRRRSRCRPAGPRCGPGRSPRWRTPAGRPGTRCGTSACSAGVLSCSRTDWAAATTYSSQIRLSSVTTSSGASTATCSQGAWRRGCGGGPTGRRAPRRRTRAAPAAAPRRRAARRRPAVEPVRS